MADKGWKGPEVKGLKNNLGLSMPKHKLCDLYVEEKKQARKRNICEIQPTSHIPSKRLHSYPKFDILAAHYKGLIARVEVSRKKYLFYTI
jgi:hypothetical protein